MRNIHMERLKGMANNLNNNEKATTPWSKVILYDNCFFLCEIPKVRFFLVFHCLLFENFTWTLFIYVRNR